jgi:hypothetical protein
MAAAPYSERFREKREEKPSVSVEDAIKVLAGAAKSPQQQATVKNAYRVFEGHHDNQGKQDEPTPGQKAAGFPTTRAKETPAPEAKA